MSDDKKARSRFFRTGYFLGYFGVPLLVGFVAFTFTLFVIDVLERMS